MTNSDSQEFGVWDFSEFSPDTILATEALAKMFQCTTECVRQMAKRGELPPGVKMRGRLTWLVSDILDHRRRRFQRASGIQARHGVA